MSEKMEPAEPTCRPEQNSAGADTDISIPFNGTGDPNFQTNIESQQYKKYWFDYVTLIVAGMALIVSFASSFYSYRQVSIAGDTEQRSLRAYISADGKFSDGQTGIELAANPTGIIGNPYDGWVAFRNTGDTPAYKLVVWMGADILPLPLPQNFLFPTSRIKGRNTLPRHSTAFASKQSFEPITIGNILAVGSKKMAVYLYGTITYTDAFKALHYTNFCEAYTGTRLEEADDCETHEDSN